MTTCAERHPAHEGLEPVLTMSPSTPGGCIGRRIGDSFAKVPNPLPWPFVRGGRNPQPLLEILQLVRVRLARQVNATSP